MPKITAWFLGWNLINLLICDNFNKNNGNPTSYLNFIAQPSKIHTFFAAFKL